MQHYPIRFVEKAKSIECLYNDGKNIHDFIEHCGDALVGFKCRAEGKFAPEVYCTASGYNRYIVTVEPGNYLVKQDDGFLSSEKLEDLMKNYVPMK